MARPRKPWYLKSRQTWNVWINGKQHNLGPDKEEALRKYHALMATAPKPLAKDSVTDILDQFLAHSKKHKEPSTHRWYKRYIDEFKAFLTDNGFEPETLHPEDISPSIVRDFADQLGAERARITCVKAAYSWAHAEGTLITNPIAGMKRPPAPKREGLVSLIEMKAILRLCNRPFRELLIVSWDTGARPQELRKLEPRHLELKNRRAIFPAAEAKGKKKPRVIYLTPRAVRIIKRNGGRFLNSEGNPWTASAVKCTFARLEKKLGRRFCQYHFRHAFATRKLKDGISPIVVAELLGHADVSTLAKVYQHIAQDPAHLLTALDTKSA